MLRAPLAKLRIPSPQLLDEVSIHMDILVLVRMLLRLIQTR